MGVTQTERPQPPTLRITLPGWAAGLREPVLLGAVSLIAISLVLRALILKDSYFVEDDLLFVGNAYESGLTPDFVTRVHKGHFMPGALALTWVLSRIAPYDWLLVATVTFLAQGLLGVLALRLLRSLFGTRPAVLLPLAVLLLCPLTVPPLGWWASALNAVPLQLAMVLALTAQVRFARGEGARYGRHAMAWTVMGMAFSTKGVFVAFLLFAVTTAFLRDREAGWIRSMLAELGRHRRLWGAYAVLLAAYTALYLARRDTAPGEGASTPRLDVAVDLVGLMLGRTFPSGAVGGPFTWSPVTPAGGMAGPSDVVVAVSWLVLAALVAVTVAYRRRALRVWVILAGYLVLADAVPTVIARGGHVALVGAEARYVADAVVVFAVGLGLALLPLRGETDAYRRPLPGRSALSLAAGLAAGAYLVASVVSTEAYRATLSGDRVRAYLETVAAELARVPDDVVIYPAPVPDDIVLPLNGDRRLSDRLLAPLARPAIRTRMAHPEPSHEAVVFGKDGRLARMSIFGFFRTPAQGEGCLRSVDGAVVLPEAVSENRRGFAGALSYAADRPLSATVEIGGEQIVLNLRRTPGDRVHFPVSGSGRGMRVVMDDPAAQVCVTGVALGVPKAEGE
ncbi:hypothetical protein [Planomonospora parontospora]|uniref:hypothetical protein n=1 Tax=Planomonospora parontospora TaxID=58119 RepID=UPI00166FB73B|nr:hypothetical protein [Planomonospora parontospora]GGL08376.1 hypothetical protein GCM10014719_08030 [Planomonospora parontospora subsp. antibiotica]GII14542.1 hypothetical protein Ppa05_12680 [Planomonospora parontospora subsp. antibiotica]